jgi:hypothetical protein
MCGTTGCIRSIYGTFLSYDSTCGITEAHPKELGVLDSNLAPIDLALSALIGDKILCLATNTATRKWLLTVIFDTGASLAIVPDLLDFISPPKPLSHLMRLGWMAH